MKRAVEKFSPVDIDDDAPTEKVEAFVSHLRTFQQELHAKGFETQIVRLPELKAFDEILFIKRKEEDKMREPTVRVYRGIGTQNTSIRQEPYAIRAEHYNEGDGRKPRIIDAARPTLEKLLAQPTYSNLIAHMEAMRPHWSKMEWNSHMEDLRTIEDGILNGETLRRLLISQQHTHNGTMTADSGLAPYVSASYNPVEAVKYSRGAVMILDIPVSQIEEWSADSSGEVCIKGTVLEKYVSAIVGRHCVYPDDLARNEFAEQIVPRIETVAHRNGYSFIDIQHARQVKIETEKALDEQMRHYDVLAIQEKMRREGNQQRIVRRARMVIDADEI